MLITLKLLRQNLYRLACFPGCFCHFPHRDKQCLHVSNSVIPKLLRDNGWSASARSCGQLNQHDDFLFGRTGQTSSRRHRSHFVLLAYA